MSGPVNARLDSCVQPGKCAVVEAARGGCKEGVKRFQLYSLNAGVCPARAAQAQKYASLRKPYLINDMAMQDVLLDRRRVYQKLQVPPASIGTAV